MKVRADVKGVRLIVVESAGRWSISIIGSDGDYLKPLHDFADSLDSAKLRACKRASTAFDFDYDDDACKQIPWEEF